MTQWFEQKEQGAGSLRLKFLLAVYRIFGKKTVRILLVPIVFWIYACAPKARRSSQKYLKILNTYQQAHQLPVTHFSSFRHILHFAYGLLDKLEVFMGKSLPLEVEESEDAQKLFQVLQAGKGAFFISSHQGNIEVLPALLKVRPDLPAHTMHAFMQVSQNSLFHRLMTQNTTLTDVIIHPIENINIGLIGDIFDKVKQGDLVMMAGDRVAAENPSATVSVRILDKICHLPKGVFRLAKSFEVPVFFLNVVWQKNTYHLKVCAAEKISPTAYAAFLEKSILAAPLDWGHFYDFFESE